MLSIFVVVKFFFWFDILLSSSFQIFYRVTTFIHSLTRSFTFTFICCYMESALWCHKTIQGDTMHCHKTLRNWWWPPFWMVPFFRGKNSTRHIFYSKSVIQFLSIWSLYYMDNGVLLRITFGIWFNEYFRGEKMGTANIIQFLWLRLCLFYGKFMSIS